jgi:PAS domain S-box-containing protein
MVDTEGRIQLVNVEVEQLFGHTRQELLGQPIEMLVPHTTRQAHPSYRQDFIAQAIPRPMGAGHDLFGLHKDGHTIPVEIGLNPIETMEGQMIIGTIVDISARKRAEAILRESEERLRLATEAGRIGIFDHDMRTGQTQFSPIYCEIGQFSPDQPPTQEEWLARIHPEDRALVKNTVQRARETGQAYHHAYRIATPDQGIRWIEVNTFVAKDAQGQPFRLTGAVQDVTERKQIEEFLRDTNKGLEQRVLARTAQLEATNKELEAFTYSVSHDLRAPLRAMGSFSEILLQQYGPELAEKPRHYLQRIRHNAQQMGQLIDDLLAFSRLWRQPLQKQTVAPVVLVEQVLIDLGLEQEGRLLEIALADLPTCQADPHLLKQVFANLLANAFKYTRKQPQTRIEIGWQTLQHDDDSPPESVYFVRDNGVGFDMRYVDKLFGVFQRLHSHDEYEGTGVGLATVQRIIHRHGGHIWAQAEVDKGASFYFTLGKIWPASNDEPASHGGA